MTHRRENTVRNLQQLYSVVAGVALSIAIVEVVDPSVGPFPVSPESGVLLLAFLATLIPFYHGALRHLDDTYLEDDSPNVRAGALMMDFLLLFLEGVLFVGLALLLGRPALFAAGFLTLLVLDIVWGIVAHLAFSRAGGQKAEWKWVQNNVGALLILE